MGLTEVVNRGQNKVTNRGLPNVAGAVGYCRVESSWQLKVRREERAAGLKGCVRGGAREALKSIKPTFSR